MIITKTPFRISFVGGGSDLSAFYHNSPGAVLSTSINKYMYISSHQFFEKNKIRVKYSQTETVGSTSELEHPIFKTIFDQFNCNGGIEVSSIADIPSGTGMGSSSSFTVGLLHNMYARHNQLARKELLAEDACNIEINVLKEPIGKQDQYAAAFGGMNVIRFSADESVQVEPIYLNKEVMQKLEDNLILFFFGQQRKASSILQEQKTNTSQEKRFKALQQMVDLVDEMQKVLYKNELNEFGRLLHENWLLKQQLASKISNPEINEVYEKALKNGAKGGKLLGAGAGGFMLFYCEKENQKKLKQALMPLQEFPFKFDKEGSKILYIGDE